MASREKEDLSYKGGKLWEALKSDPVDHKVLRELLRDGAPANFREPDSEVRKGRKYVFYNLGFVMELVFSIWKINRTTTTL